MEEGGVDLPINVPDSQWKKWFAWYPVEIHSKKMWLRSVYRRRRIRPVDGGLVYAWQYGNIFDVLSK